MIASLYVAGNTWLHRLPAGCKLGVLALLGAVLIGVAHWWWLLVPLALVAWALWLSGVSARQFWQQSRLLLVLILLVALAAGAWHGVEQALLVALRMGVLVGLALVVSFTTPTQAMIETLERCLQPLARRGWVQPQRITLALGLCLRFVPELRLRWQMIRQAQAARGIKARPITLVLPLVVSVLHSAEVIADAIDARGFSPGDKPNETE